MKVPVLRAGILIATFVLGVFVNTLVIRAARYFVPDVDKLLKHEVVIKCEKIA